MLRMTWRNIFARKVRLALSAFAIVLGVAFVAGSFIFTDAMGNAFDGIIEGSTSDVEVAAKGANDFTAQEDNRVLAAVRGRPARAELPEAESVHAQVRSLQTVYVIGRDGKVVGGNGPPGLAGNDTGARSVDRQADPLPRPAAGCPSRDVRGRPRRGRRRARPGTTVGDRGHAGHLGPARRR